MNIFKSVKELWDGTTGFKSKCVAFSYTMFSMVIGIIIIATVGLVIFGIVSNDHTVYIQAVKEIFIPIIQTCATFFGVAIGFTFGAQMVDKPKPPMSNNTQTDPVQ